MCEIVIMYVCVDVWVPGLKQNTDHVFNYGL